MPTATSRYPGGGSADSRRQGNGHHRHYHCSDRMKLNKRRQSPTGERSERPPGSGHTGPGFTPGTRTVFHHLTLARKPVQEASKSRNRQRSPLRILLRQSGRYSTKEGLADAHAKGRSLGRPKGSLGTSRLDSKEGGIQRARSPKAVDHGTSDSPKRSVFPRNLIVLLCAPDVDLTITYLILLVYFRGLLT